MQQTIHTLRTSGDMDFDDISRVIPFIEVNSRLGLDLDLEQRAQPRAFKTHLGWDHVPRGGRYVVVFRHPADAALSSANFLDGMVFERGSVSADEQVQKLFLAGRGYYEHLRSWWPRRHDEDTLFIGCELMLADRERAIGQVADFIGVALSDERLATTLHHTSREFMLEHGDRFDDRMMRDAGILPAGTDASKVTAGAPAPLSAETISLLDEAWSEEIDGQLGFESYEDVIATLA